MIKVHDHTLNELELIQVLDKLTQRGVQYADIYRGNDCIWVARGSSSCPINEYYIFNNGQLFDIQID